MAFTLQQKRRYLKMSVYDCMYAVRACRACPRLIQHCSFNLKDGHNCKYSLLYIPLVKILSNLLQSMLCTSTVHDFHVIFYCKCFDRSCICCHLTSDEGLQNTYVIIKRITLNKMLLINKQAELSEFEPTP